jgi:hypothetical protein
MNNYLNYDTERLEILCIQSASDSIPFENFLSISSKNGWIDYLESCENITKLFEKFGMKELTKHLTVSPCMLKGYSNKLEYSIMYDVEDKIYLGTTMMYDLYQKFIMVYMCEYNKKIANNSKPVYFVERIFGPFFIDYPLNNQEFEEAFKILCYRINRSLKMISENE